jgi:hypothetical protein
MQCKKCLAAGAICVCALSNAYLTGKFEAVACGEFPRPASIHLSLCDLPTADMPHNEPGEMPGRPLPNLEAAVSSTSSSTVASATTLPTT